MDRLILNFIAETVEAYPRVSGMVLGIAMHPLFSFILTGR